MKASLRTELAQKFADLDETETDIRSLSSLLESIPEQAKEAAQLWREAVQRGEKTKKLSLFYVAHELITSTRSKTQVFIKAFGDQMLQAADSYCKGNYDVKKLDSLFKLGELWLRLRIYSDTFVAQLQSLVSARKHYLSDNLNKIDTEVIDLLDEFKKTKTERICYSILRRADETTRSVEQALQNEGKEDLEKLNNELSKAVMKRMEDLGLLGGQMEAAIEQMEEIERDKEEAKMMREKLKEIENQESYF